MDAKNKVSRVYGSFRGVDFRGEEINLIRSPDSLNMWKDYKETESIRTRPAMEIVEAFPGKIYGIFFFKDKMFVHSGHSLYTMNYDVLERDNGERYVKVREGTKYIQYDNLKEHESVGFTYGDTWFFKDGKNYYKFEGTGPLTHVKPYVPTTSVSKAAAEEADESGGVVFQDVNFLTGERINTFRGDGENKVFQLDAYPLDDNTVPTVTVDGFMLNVTGGFSFDRATGVVTISTPPAAPASGDNVVIRFSKTVPGYADRILKCTMIQVFDNRVFFSGNPDFPNAVFHSSLDDPTYCSDKDVYYEGIGEAKVKGLVSGNNALWVFREPSDENAAIFYHVPQMNDNYGKIYPNSNSSVSTGCVGKAINFGDDIVFFSDRGMEGISGDITTEQVLGHRSTLVDRKMITEKEYARMLLAEWEGYLLVFIGNKCFLADSRAMFTNDTHIEYDWFYWEFSKAITSVNVYNGILFLGTNDGVYTLTDFHSPLESYWTTPKDKCKYPNRIKNTNKRGCVVEAQGDVDVYAKTEKSDFEHIGSYTAVEDYFTSRIKRKKFKDIQLMFHSNTRFSLETATLEVFVGGYIKR